MRKAKALGVIADAQARLDLTSLLTTDATSDAVDAGDATDLGEVAGSRAARRTALGRRDAKVRLHLHASLADVVADHDPPGDPPGATTPASLAPLCRRHHRAKTARSWTYERTGPGCYLWAGPTGLAVLVTTRGTLRLPS